MSFFWMPALASQKTFALSCKKKKESCQDYGYEIFREFVHTSNVSMACFNCKLPDITRSPFSFVRNAQLVLVKYFGLNSHDKLVNSNELRACKRIFDEEKLDT